MPISQQGAVNLTALVVPDLYVNIVPPNVATLNGVPTNIVGVVGTAQWGPVNSPTTIGSMAQYASQFGAVQPRTFDMGTAVALAVSQGANNFRCVRVTDGTDTAATIVVQTNCITFTSKYTGTAGNACLVNVSNGSAASSFNVSVSLPGAVPELFTNITGSGAALWANIALAINSGQSGLRGPSQLIVATAGVGTTSPAIAQYTLASGTDGVATITSAVMVGVDTNPRTGMYALRSQGCSVGMLADLTDATTWSAQNVFGLFEGVYMVTTGVVGDTIANAVSAKATAALDSYAMKVMFGDWIQWLDTVNGLTRTVSPQGVVCGVLANLAPQNSTLNKQIFGIVGTQKSATGINYTSADLQTLVGAGIDVICTPAPGGAYFSCRTGHNSSSNPVVQGDNYTRMTNYIAATLNAGMGIFIGQLQSPTVQANAKATLDGFFSGLYSQGMIGTSSATTIPWQVVLDGTNNLPARVTAGYMQADVQVSYLSVIEKFVLNIQGGQTVAIQRLSTQPNI